MIKKHFPKWKNRTKAVAATQIRVMTVAALALLFEITVDRVFNVILAPSLSWFVISCALFAYGLSGIFLALSKPKPSRKRENLWLILLALGLLLFRPMINLSDLTWSGHWSAFDLNYLYLFGMVSSVFAFASLYLIETFSQQRQKFGSIYFFDLLGAAAGIWLAYGLIGYLNPGQLLNLASAICFVLVASDKGLSRHSRAGVAVLAAALFLGTTFLNSSNFEFTSRISKLFTESRNEIELSEWDPMAKIDVVNQGNGNRTLVYDDGEIISTIYRFDGDFAKLRREIDTRKNTDFWSPDVLAAHWLKDEKRARVFLVGVAGGQEIKAALLTGASRIDATELIGTVIGIAHKYDWLTGHLLSRPEVHVFHREGRAFLHSEPRQKYDIIQIFSAVTRSSLGTKAPFRENPILTSEAMLEYFRHLARNGILQITHFGFERELITLARAWKRMGRSDLQAHVMIIDRADVDDRTPTLLVKRENWTAEEIQKLKQLYGIPIESERNDQFRIINDPLRPELASLGPEYFTVDRSWLRKLKYNLSPVTDDRPFFGSVMKLGGGRGKMFPKFNTPTLRSEGHVAHMFRSFRLMIVVLCLLSGALAWFGRERRGLRFSSWTASWYFASIGFGFVVLEQNVIHQLLLVAGAPSLAFVTGVFALLLSAAIGSYCSQFLPKTWSLFFLLVAGMIYASSSRFFFHQCLSWQLPVALLSSCLYLFPLGLGLGAAFPIGVKMWAEEFDGAMALAWFYNGLFSAIGGYLGFLLSLRFGFHTQAWIGVWVYAFAAGLVLLAELRPAGIRLTMHLDESR